MISLGRVNVVRLESRCRVRHFQVAVDPVAVAGAGGNAVDEMLAPAIGIAGKRIFAAHRRTFEAKGDVATVRRPDAEQRASILKMRAERVRQR